MTKLLAPLAALFLLAFLAAPFAVARMMRQNPKRQPRIHMVPDMDSQPKYKGQAELGAFADGRAMRPHPDGVVPWSLAPPDEAFEAGTAGEAWIEGHPPQVAVDEALLARGAARYAIYCMPCHGGTGAGDGPVALAARRRGEANWVDPTPLNSAEMSTRPGGHLFNTITNGIRTMPAYGPLIPAGDRWAIVAHLRALQGTVPAPAAK